MIQLKIITFCVMQLNILKLKKSLLILTDIKEVQNQQQL